MSIKRGDELYPDDIYRIMSLADEDEEWWYFKDPEIYPNVVVVTKDIEIIIKYKISDQGD
jgi:hypothetical protein